MMIEYSIVIGLEDDDPRVIAKFKAINKKEAAKKWVRSIFGKAKFELEKKDNGSYLAYEKGWLPVCEPFWVRN